MAEVLAAHCNESLVDAIALYNRVLAHDGRQAGATRLKEHGLAAVRQARGDACPDCSAQGGQCAGVI
jgi:hypothetical protein